VPVRVDMDGGGGGGSEPLSLSARALASSLHTSLLGHAVALGSLTGQPPSVRERESGRESERATAFEKYFADTLTDPRGCSTPT